MMSNNRNTNRNRSRRKSAQIAFCGLMIALSVMLMLSGGLLPIATYCAPMASAILLLPILLEFGKKSAWTAYIAVSLIVLMLGIDKEAAFFYLFIGYYPLLKWDIERIPSKPLKLLCKLFVLNASIGLMYALLAFLFHMDAVVADFTSMGWVLLIAFILILNVCLLLYDRLLYPMLVLYVRKIKPRLSFIH